MTDEVKPETAKAKTLRERAERDYAALQANGLSTGETFYPPGTEAVAGRTAIKRARQEFLSLPNAVEALNGLADTVQAEDRQDIKAIFGSAPSEAIQEYPLLSTAASGLTLYRKVENINLVPTERAVTQMQVRKPLGHPATSWDLGNWIEDVEPKEVLLRTRSMPQSRTDIGLGNSRELFAMVSPDYVPYDIDQAAHDLIAACPADSRARIRYDGARTRCDIILQNPYRFEGMDCAAVGETHRMVLRMTTSDDGSAGYHLSLLAERVRCINLTLLHSKKFLLKATHRRDDLASLANEAIARGGELMAKFAEVWSTAWLEYYGDKAMGGTISGDEALKRIVIGDKFRIAGHSEDSTLAAVLQAWNQEPGDTKAHVHNALTRAAHEATTSWGSRWADDDAEVMASQLLYQNLTWLPEVHAD